MLLASVFLHLFDTTREVTLTTGGEEQKNWAKGWILAVLPIFPFSGNPLLLLIESNRGIMEGDTFQKMGSATSIQPGSIYP